MSPQTRRVEAFRCDRQPTPAWITWTACRNRRKSAQDAAARARRGVMVNVSLGACLECEVGRQINRGVRPEGLKWKFLEEQLPSPQPKARPELRKPNVVKPASEPAAASEPPLVRSVSTRLAMLVLERAAEHSAAQGTRLPNLAVGYAELRKATALLARARKRRPPNPQAVTERIVRVGAMAVRMLAECCVDDWIQPKGGGK